MTAVRAGSESLGEFPVWADHDAVEVVDPVTGIMFVELSHEWGAHTPIYPGYPDIQIRRAVTHASHGVMSQHIRTVMHHGTHVNAPLHLIQRGAGVGDLDLERFFGNGVVLGVEKGEWELIEPSDLEVASGAETLQAGDIVIINTGWHRRYADSQEYFGQGPGLSEAAARWLIDRGAKLVGIDTASIDHPMATSLGQHRGGPIVKGLIKRYGERFGHEPREDFTDWLPAHRALLGAGIPTIENAGGHLDHVTGRRATFQATPWNWPDGDACVVRLVAIYDPSGDYRLEPGAQA
jgi:kynurenine formamidase